MNEVVKASIARVSFTLTKEAYAILENYLNELKDFYMKEGKKADEEIVDDIEQRIVELLYERGKRDGVVNESDISEIIGILGRPRDFECKESSESCEKDAYGNRAKSDTYNAANTCGAESGRVKKSLFRDMNRKVIGGVCGGLSHYFNIDVAFIRVVLVVLLLLPMLFHISDCCWLDIPHTIFSTIRKITVLAYLALWIAMPAARTAQQRCKMMGLDEGVDGIERMRSAKGTNPHVQARGEEIGRAIKCLMGIILMIIGISLLICGISMAIFFGSEEFSFFGDLSIWQSFNLLDLGLTSNLTYLKALAIASWMVPSAGILYGGTMLTFNLKAPKWRPGLILFLLTVALWIITIAYITKGAITYSSSQYMKEVADLPANSSDTLFITLDKAHGITGSPARSWNEDDNKLDVTEIYRINGKASVVKYPELRIKRNSVSDEITITQNNDTIVSVGGKSTFEPYLKCSWKERFSFTSGELASGTRSYTSDSFFSLKDSLLTIKPLVIDNNNKYTFTEPKIVLYVDASTPVVILNREAFGNKKYGKEIFGE